MVAGMRATLGIFAVRTHTVAQVLIKDKGLVYTAASTSASVIFVCGAIIGTLVTHLHDVHVTRHASRAQGSVRNSLCTVGDILVTRRNHATAVSRVVHEAILERFAAPLVGNFDEARLADGATIIDVETSMA